MRPLFIHVNSTQITLYYVSEGNVLNSSDYSGGVWSPSFNSSLGNYSTALYTRSLSVALTDILLPLNSADSNNATLLYYENPSGNVSALLQQGGRWVDITSQGSKSLPHEFRDTPTTSESYTLYESANIGMPRIPFACGANWSSPGAIGAIFYSSSASELEGLSFTGNSYRSGSSGPGTFAECMHYVPRTPYNYQYVDLYNSRHKRFVLDELFDPRL